MLLMNTELAIRFSASMHQGGAMLHTSTSLCCLKGNSATILKFRCGSRRHSCGSDTRIKACGESGKGSTV